MLGALWCVFAPVRWFWFLFVVAGCVAPPAPGCGLCASVFLPLAAASLSPSFLSLAFCGRGFASLGRSVGFARRWVRPGVVLRTLLAAASAVSARPGCCARGGKQLAPRRRRLRPASFSSGLGLDAAASLAGVPAVSCCSAKVAPSQRRARRKAQTGPETDSGAPFTLRVGLCKPPALLL